MRQLIKFPHRTKPVEREVHHGQGGHYIVSCGFNVPVVVFDGQWMTDRHWDWVYKEVKK